MLGRYQIIPYPSEFVIRDENGKKIVSCPTEQEAQEYIDTVLKEEAGASSFFHGGMGNED